MSENIKKLKRNIANYIFKVAKDNKKLASSVIYVLTCIGKDTTFGDWMQPKLAGLLGQLYFDEVFGATL